jgi:hypothetical protein
MPTIWIPDDELEALQAILRKEEKVNWTAYDKAKVRLATTPLLNEGERCGCGDKIGHIERCDFR